MEPFKSILIDVDPAATAHPAFNRAVRIARRCGAKLTVTAVAAIPSPARRSLPPGLEDELLALRQRQLDALARTAAGVQVETKLLTGRPGTVLIQEVLRSNHDLLVRSHARDLAPRGHMPFGAVDMELVRRCPCPVLLVQHGGSQPHPPIAAAVNASTEDDAERALNRKIVDTALLMSRLEDGSTTLLHAWAPFADGMIRSHASDEAYAAYVEEVRKQSSEDLNALAQSFGDQLTGARLASVRGEPEEAIPAFVVDEGIDLIVMGTVARSGLAGLLIGNTAERLLRKLPCSVMTVKPDGFVSPVKLDAS